MIVKIKTPEQGWPTSQMLRATFRTVFQQRAISYTQGRREKFRAPGQKFRLEPLVSGAPKSRDEQRKKKKKGHSLRRCSNFSPK